MNENSLDYCYQINGFHKDIYNIDIQAVTKGMFHTVKGGKLKAERRHFTLRKDTYQIKRIQRTALKTAW